MEDLHALLGKSVYAYLILPVPSIVYFKENLERLIDSLDGREDIEIEVSQRSKDYIELKVAVTPEGKNYTTDWDVLLERIKECQELKRENLQLKEWNKCLAEKRHEELQSC